MRFAVAFAFATCALVGPLSAEEPQPIELTIRACAIETPVLKYRLLPAEADMKPGDAAPILLRLPWEQAKWMNEVFPSLSEWESRPLDAPEWENSGGVLPERFFDEMKRAAFRRDAHWEYPIGETTSPYLILLPDVQGLRGFLGYGLAARIRYHISRGELEQAREGILVGLTNGRHLAQTPFYIVQLVALAIHRSMLDRTAELISQPDSPNLYWALSTLPDSLIELDRAASLASSMFSMTLPAANDLDQPRDAEEWQKMGEQLVNLLIEFDELPRPLQKRRSDWAPDQIAKWAPSARDELPGLLQVPTEKVAAMSDAEASVRWYVHQRLAIDQRMAAVTSLAPREALPQFIQLKREIKTMHEKASTREAEVFDPAAIYVTAWSLRRKIAALRIIEAVRHYLAEHDGKLPATLDEVDGAPIPRDPLMDQPFIWQIDGKTALLKAPSLPDRILAPDSSAQGNSQVQYRLRVE